MNELTSKLIAGLSPDLISFILNNMIIACVLSIMIILLLQSAKVTSSKVFSYYLTRKQLLISSLLSSLIFAVLLYLMVKMNRGAVFFILLNMAYLTTLLYDKFIKIVFKSIEILNMRLKNFIIIADKDYKQVELEIIKLDILENELKKEKKLKEGR